MVGALSACVPAYDGIPQTLTTNPEAEGLRLVRERSGRVLSKVQTFHGGPRRSRMQLESGGAVARGKEKGKA